MDTTVETAPPAEQPDRSDARPAFIDRMGDHMEAEGMPHIAGRLFGLLVLAAEPISFSALAELLSVSRGSVSTNARLLETKGLIERVRPEGERQEFFRLAGDPYANMVQSVAARMRGIQETITEAQEAIGSEDTTEQRRLTEAHRFFETFVASLEDLARKLAAPQETSPNDRTDA